MYRVNKKTKEGSFSLQERHMWTEEDDRLLREMSENNYSSGDMAQEMRLTRNQVVSRCRKMGIRLKARKPRSNFNVPILKKPRGDGFIIYASTPKAKEFSGITDNGFVLGPGISLLEAENNQCRWSYGDPRGLLFCGRETISKRSYCIDHTVAAYQKLKCDHVISPPMSEDIDG